MKPNKSNKLANLPAADRDRVLTLCSQHRYEDIVDILLLPREEGGLDLLTSTSALCRFYKSTHPEPSRAVLAQYASAAQVQHERENNAFLGAIRAAVEARVLENLRTGKPLADMEKDFKLLKISQSIYLADAEWRRKNPQLANAAYKKLIQECAQAPENDFYLDEDLSAPRARENLLEQTPLEKDILEARREQKLRDEYGAELARNFRSLQSQLAPVPPPETEKSPEIPPFPANSTSRNSPSNSPLSSEAPAPHSEKGPALLMKPKPFIAAAKIGRNDPCPCGSGLKHKKCCLNRHSTVRLAA